MREKVQLRGGEFVEEAKKITSNGGVFSGEQRGETGESSTCSGAIGTKWVLPRAKGPKSQKVGFWAPMEQMIFQGQ